MRISFKLKVFINRKNCKNEGGTNFNNSSGNFITKFFEIGYDITFKIVATLTTNKRQQIVIILDM